MDQGITPDSFCVFFEGEESGVQEAGAKELENVLRLLLMCRTKC